MGIPVVDPGKERTLRRRVPQPGQDGIVDLSRRPLIEEDPLLGAEPTPTEILLTHRDVVIVEVEALVESELAGQREGSDRRGRGVAGVREDLRHRRPRARQAKEAVVADTVRQGIQAREDRRVRWQGHWHRGHRLQKEGPLRG